MHIEEISEDWCGIRGAKVALENINNKIMHSGDMEGAEKKPKVGWQDSELKQFIENLETRRDEILNLLKKKLQNLKNRDDKTTTPAAGRQAALRKQGTGVRSPHHVKSLSPDARKRLSRAAVEMMVGNEKIASSVSSFDSGGGKSRKRRRRKKKTRRRRGGRRKKKRSSKKKRSRKKKRKIRRTR